MTESNVVALLCPVVLLVALVLLYIAWKYGRVLRVHNRAILELQEWQKAEYERKGWK